MTEALIEQLRRQRESILRSLLRLRSLAHHYREARKWTGGCREEVYLYLGRQGDAFYDHLREYYKENRPALKIIEFLIQDLKELKVKSFIFFEKYGADNPLEQGRHFVRDLREYQQTVEDRFRAEDDYLNPILQRIPDDAGFSHLRLLRDKEYA